MLEDSYEGEGDQEVQRAFNVDVEDCTPPPPSKKKNTGKKTSGRGRGRGKGRGKGPTPTPGRGDLESSLEITK